MALSNGRGNNRAALPTVQRSVIRRRGRGLSETIAAPRRRRYRPAARFVPECEGRGAYMRRGLLLAAMLSAVATIACADNSKPADKDKNKPESAVAQYFKNDDTGTDSSVSVEGSSVSYHAIAGT